MPVTRGQAKFYPVGTQDVKVANTVAISGTVDGTFAGGTQYVMSTTAGGDSKLGTLIVGVDATTAYALAITTTGGVKFIDTLGAITTGTVDVVNIVTISGTVDGTFAGGTQYIQATTAGDNTKLGGIIMGVDATTARAIAVSATGGIKFIDTLGSITTGTVNIANIITISGTVSNTPIATTATLGGVRLVAHDSRWQAYVVATTSAAAGVIVMTSGAHTLYVSDLLVSVDGPMDVDVRSETTAGLATVYLATKGGFALNLINPIVCTSAQSLRVIPSSSGKCAVTAVGYTVT